MSPNTLRADVRVSLRPSKAASALPGVAPGSGELRHLELAPELSAGYCRPETNRLPAPKVFALLPIHSTRRIPSAGPRLRLPDSSFSWPGNHLQYVFQGDHPLSRLMRNVRYEDGTLKPIPRFPDPTPSLSCSISCT